MQVLQALCNQDNQEAFHKAWSAFFLNPELVRQVATGVEKDKAAEEERLAKELKEIKQRRLESGSSVAAAVSRDSAGGQGSHQAAPAKQGEESQASELEKELVRVKQTAAERMAASGPVAGAPGELSSG